MMVTDLITREHVEAVACCIVREYLFRKSQQITDLRDVLTAMEKAFPRSALCFQQRDQLIRAIHLEKPCRENKNAAVSFKTLLEIVVADRLEKRRLKYLTQDMGRFGMNVRIETVENERGESRNEVVFSTLDPPRTVRVSAPTPAAVPVESSALTPTPTVTREVGADEPFTSSVDNQKRHSPLKQRASSSKIKSDGFSSDDDDDDDDDKNDDDDDKNDDKAEEQVKDRDDRARPQSARLRFDHIRAEQAKEPALRRRKSAWSNLTRPTTGSFDLRRHRAAPGSVSLGAALEPLQPWPSFAAGEKNTVAGSTTALLEHADSLIRRKTAQQMAALPFQQILKKDELDKNTQLVKKESMSKLEPTTIKHEELLKAPQSSAKGGDISMEDLSNEPDDHCNFNRAPQKGFAHRKITVSENEQLQMLLFGDSSRGFGLEWLEQKLEFAQEANSSEVSYGLKQNKGGPCGVLAVTQAYLLKHLLWPDGVLTTDDRYEQVYAADWRRRRALLMMALKEIIVQSNPKGPFKYVLGPVSYKHRTPFTALTIYNLPTSDQLSDFLTSNVSGILQSGVVQLLISVVLSRGVDVVRKDMDQPDHPLIGRHNHTSQEVVNLMLFGHASSNLFDGVLHIDSTVLRGVPHQSTCGLLSLMESTGIIEVGSFLKSPKFPIWVVLAENHYFVLFGTSGTVLTTTGEFRLYVFDGLAGQLKNRVIRVAPSPMRKVRFENSPIHLGSTELCIKTKWNQAFVEDCSPSESSAL